MVVMTTKGEMTMMGSMATMKLEPMVMFTLGVHTLIMTQLRGGTVIQMTLGIATIIIITQVKFIARPGLRLQPSRWGVSAALSVQKCLLVGMTRSRWCLHPLLLFRGRWNVGRCGPLLGPLGAH